MIPLGTTFGIKLFTDGVIVASLSDIYTETGLCCPAAEAGLRPGDYLLEADSKLLESNTDLARIIGASEGRELRLKVRREDEVFETSVTPVYGDGSFKPACGCATAPQASEPSPSTTLKPAFLPVWATASATWTPAASWP